MARCLNPKSRKSGRARQTANRSPSTTPRRLVTFVRSPAIRPYKAQIRQRPRIKTLTKTDISCLVRDTLSNDCTIGGSNLPPTDPATSTNRQFTKPGAQSRVTRALGASLDGWAGGASLRHCGLAYRRKPRAVTCYVQISVHSGPNSGARTCPSARQFARPHHPKVPLQHHAWRRNLVVPASTP